MSVSSAELEGLSALVAAYQAAELAVLRNQSYEMPDGRKLARANLTEIRKGRREAEQQLATATGAAPLPRGRARAGVLGGRSRY